MVVLGSRLRLSLIEVNVDGQQLAELHELIGHDKGHKLCRQRRIARWQHKGLLKRRRG